MGYYTCPRCGGHDVYTGNVIVNKKGTNITHEIGNTGVYRTYESGGGTHTEQVVKCRHCGDILSESNYFKSREEKLMDERTERFHRDLDRKFLFFLFGAILFFIIMMVFIICIT